MSAARPLVVHTESVQALGGQTLRLIDEARALERAGWCCVLVGQAGSEFERRARGSAEFLPFRFHGGSLHPGGLWRARALLARLAPAVVHTHSSHDAWVFGLAARTLGLPIVRGRHISKPVPRRGPGRLVYTRLADAFTVSGASIGRALVESGVARPERVFDTPAGLDLERFDPARAPRGELRGELGWPAGEPLLGTVGNLRSMKGIDVLLGALRRLLAGEGGEAPIPARLVVAGSGDPSLFASAMAGLEERVRFLGFRDRIEGVIADLDRMVLASTRGEGVPQALLQAMALGVPVVATRAGGVPDAVEDGRTGLLAEPGDERDLARVLRRSLVLPAAERDRMTDAARERIRREHSLERVVARYLAAYALVLA